MYISVTFRCLQYINSIYIYIYIYINIYIYIYTHNIYIYIYIYILWILNWLIIIYYPKYNSYLSILILSLSYTGCIYGIMFNIFTFSLKLFLVFYLKSVSVFKMCHNSQCEKCITLYLLSTDRCFQRTQLISVCIAVVLKLGATLHWYLLAISLGHLMMCNFMIYKIHYK